MTAHTPHACRVSFPVVALYGIVVGTNKFNSHVQITNQTGPDGIVKPDLSTKTAPSLQHQSWWPHIYPSVSVSVSVPAPSPAVSPSPLLREHCLVL